MGLPKCSGTHPFVFQRRKARGDGVASCLICQKAGFWPMQSTGAFDDGGRRILAPEKGLQGLFFNESV